MQGEMYDMRARVKLLVSRIEEKFRRSRYGKMGNVSFSTCPFATETFSFKDS